MRRLWFDSPSEPLVIADIEQIMKTSIPFALLIAASFVAVAAGQDQPPPAPAAQPEAPTRSDAVKAEKSPKEEPAAANAKELSLEGELAELTDELSASRSLRNQLIGNLASTDRARKTAMENELEKKFITLVVQFMSQPAPFAGGQLPRAKPTPKTPAPEEVEVIVNPPDGFALAKNHFLKGNFKEALAQLEAFKKDPENKDVLEDSDQMLLVNSLLAGCYRRTGDAEKAEAIYQSIIESKTGGEFKLLKKYAEWNFNGLQELKEIKQSLQDIERLKADLRPAAKRSSVPDTTGGKSAPSPGN